MQSFDHIPLLLPTYKVYKEHQPALAVNQSFKCHINKFVPFVGKFDCGLVFFAQQGYSGKDFKCDFEDAGMCGWKDASLNAAVYSWERRQRGDTLPDSGPASDYTIGTATGTVDISGVCFHLLLTTAHLNSFKQYSV